MWSITTHVESCTHRNPTEVLVIRRLPYFLTLLSYRTVYPLPQGFLLNPFALYLVVEYMYEQNYLRKLYVNRCSMKNRAVPPGLIL
jgi:hypothetical protein